VLERAQVLEAYQQLKGALDLMESKYGSGDLVELAKEAQANERRADVWRAALRAAGDKDFADVVGGAGRIAADPAELEAFRKDLKARFRSQMLDANIQRGDENGYAAEALKDGRELTEANLPAATPDGIGSRATAVPRPERKDEKARNMPFAIIELLAEGKSLGKYLVNATLNRQKVEAGGKTWEMAMRVERFYVPFSLKLLKATHDVYQGTEIPKDYRSRVLLQNPAANERRETEIYMNQPLRYGGLTFYQSQMGEDQRNRAVKTSGLQVVENPSWLTPYAGCLVVGLGMLWQFLWHLSKFFSKRIGLPAPEIGQPHPILPIAAAVFVLPDLHQRIADEAVVRLVPSFLDDGNAAEGVRLEIFLRRQAEGAEDPRGKEREERVGNPLFPIVHTRAGSRRLVMAKTTAPTTAVCATTRGQSMLPIIS
jgi:hypothetical protein